MCFDLVWKITFQLFSSLISCLTTYFFLGQYESHQKARIACVTGRMDSIQKKEEKEKLIDVQNFFFIVYFFVWFMKQ